MAQCVQCGRELPAVSMGELQDRCADCRRHDSPGSNLELYNPGVHNIGDDQRVAIERADAGADEGAARRQFVLPAPVVTWALIGACVLVFAAMVYSGVSPTEPKSADLLRWGAEYGPLTLGGQWWRLVTSVFIHIGVMHLALNMWCLWQLGLLAERVFGRALFIEIYLLTGIAGGVASLAVHPLGAGAGASGAIFGIAGALIAVLYLGRSRAPRQALKATLRSLVLFAVINLALGAKIPGIDNAAHVGGLVSGLLMGALLARFAHRDAEEAAARRRYVVALMGILIIFAAVMVARAQAWTVHAYRGQRALTAGNTDSAIDELSDSVRRQPNKAYTRLLLGKAYGRKNDYARAEAEFRRAIEISPKFADARFQLGMTLFVEGRTDEAAEVFAELARLDPSDPDAYIGSGTVAAMRGNYNEAIGAFRKAVALDPGYAVAYYNVGLAAMHLGEFDEAIGAFRKAAQLEPTDYDSQYMLAQAYKAKGMSREADEALARAQTLKHN